MSPTLLVPTTEATAAKESPVLSPPPRKRRRTRRLLTCFTLLVLGLIVVGPWPADNAPYANSTYQQRSLDALADAPVAMAPGGQLQVGVAEGDITPPEGYPLAGFGARKDKSYHGIHSRCFVRALTVKSGAVTVTIVTADLLLINSKLSQAVLDQTGLLPGEIYFTASHTHSGPGGWGDHLLEKMICGPYDPQYFARLAGTLADVVLRSRHNLNNAEMAVVSVKTVDRERNRIDPAAPTDDRLMALLFRPVSSSPASSPEAPLLAMLVVFSAHPVVFAAESRVLSADYPGELIAELRRRTGCPSVQFAAGAVAEATVIKRPDSSEPEQARVLGRLLADDLYRGMRQAHYEPSVCLGNLWAPVELPSLRYPLSAGWSLSPVSTGWITDRHTHLHALRIGPALLVGFPCDYSGDLARPLVEQYAQQGCHLITTSFNGDYKGYCVPRSVFLNRRTYETRDMNFFGPWAGEYLTDLARRMLDRLGIPLRNRPEAFLPG